MEQDVAISSEGAIEVNDPKKSTISAEKKRFKQELVKKQDVYVRLTDQLERKMYNIQTKVHLDFINQMINYIDDCQQKFEDENNKFRLSYVQTGIISISCSITEYEFIFELFTYKLDERDIRNVIFISSNEKLTLDKIIEQIYQKVLTDELLQKEIRIQNMKKFMQVIKFKQFTTIYRKHFDTQPIVLIIEDLISMNCETINQLLELLHSTLDKLPVILFCGLSQATVSLQSLFKPKVLNRMCITSFSTKNTFQILDEVFHSTFIDSDLDLKFGAQCLNHFLDAFTYYDFSIKKIEHLAKLAIQDFCFSNKYSSLNGSVEKFEKNLELLSEGELKDLMSIESMQDYEIDDREAKEALVALFEEMHRSQATFLSELQALHELIGTTSLNYSFRTLYLNFLSTQLNIRSELEPLSNALKEYQPDEWRIRIESLINNDLINRTKLVSLLKQQLDKLNVLDLQVEVVEEKRESVKSPKTRAEFLKCNLKKAKSARIKEPHSPFTKWKQETINLIRDHYNDLENPSYARLNELFYYDNVELLKKYSLISFREQIIKRLVSCEQFVKTIQKHSADNHLKQKDELVNFRPEICLTFKLYRESQLKINLADWLQTYLAILGQQHEETSVCSKSPRKKQKTQPIDNLTAKFFANVADLEYLGILEKANKSTDCATKLIM